jgi:hypothetical protein
MEAACGRLQGSPFQVSRFPLRAALNGQPETGNALTEKAAASLPKEIAALGTKFLKRHPMPSGSRNEIQPLYLALLQICYNEFSSDQARQN